MRCGARGASLDLGNCGAARRRLAGISRPAPAPPSAAPCVYTSAAMSAVVTIDGGFEVETLIHVRAARCGLVVTEVASTEHLRLHGESNLRAVRDGLRVLRTIVRERVRRRAPQRPPAARAGRWRELRRGDPLDESA